MAGIYIHIPFCIKKCIYCNFYSTARTSLIDYFIKALKKEIIIKSKVYGINTERQYLFDSIYFGGGTPSVLPAKTISEILTLIKKHFRVKKNSEITIEINPGTTDGYFLESVFESGINRLNIGIQSFDDKILKFLHRIHNSDEAEKTIDLAVKAGFKNIGIDIISAIPGYSINDLIKDLNKAVSYHPEHISCYTLTCEEGTTLEKKVIKNQILMPDDTETAKNLEITSLILENGGYNQYEISNYSISPETESKHNKKYWNFDSYIGFGPSAHSFEKSLNKRSWNIPDLNSYISQLENGILPPNDFEILSPEQQMIEYFFLGLRQKKGMNINEFNDKFTSDILNDYNQLLKLLKDSGDMIIENGYIKLTKSGFMKADGIAGEFIKRI